MEELVFKEKVIILHFGELWLRGRNRNKYIFTLIRNIKNALKEYEYSLVYYYDRLILKSFKETDLDKITAIVSKIFGISSFEIGIVSKPTLQQIKATSKPFLIKNKGKTIKINSHRSFKEHKFDSVQIISELTKLAKKLDVKISNREYDAEIFISVAKEHAFIYEEKLRGSGGLPVGTSGKAVILLSGGIDSPVAAWYAMKRGLQPIFLHVHAYENNDEAYNLKMGSLYKILSSYSTKSKLYIFPSKIFEAYSASFGVSRESTVLVKAFMLRLADKIADLEKTPLIYTGESLGQVSSQTAWNLLAESIDIKNVILRPLIGMDKEEIVSIARKISTFDISIKLYKDVCTLNSNNASTSVRKSSMGNIVDLVKMDKIIENTLKEGKVFI
ncbi:MAG: tRNA uracil 4-sulfurtransferase ThiI [Candidatus Micrarchaeia archaeon]